MTATISYCAENYHSATFPRYPSLSPDGSLLAFSYLGDIWTVPSSGGRATQLTTLPAYEHSPRWSPDGNWIAFSGGRDCDDDVFVIPSSGGSPSQLTFMDVDDQICDWSVDGNSVLFSSRRDDRYPNQALLYSVKVSGGDPTPVMEAFGSEASFDKSGDKILFTRLAGQWWRKGYTSSGTAQVWIYDLKTSNYAPVSDTGTHITGEDFKLITNRWPMWGINGETILVSERDGTPNLWKISASHEWSQVTHYVGDGVRFPSKALNTNAIAYEHGTDIWILADNSTPGKVEIIAPVDDPSAIPSTKNFSDHADRLGFSPDGKQLFLSVRGEIVAGRIVGDDDKAARGRGNVLSMNSPSREIGFTVSSGGDSLVVVSDRSGNRDLYVVTSTDPETSELSRALSVSWEPLIASPDEDYDPVFSPDGKYIAFRRGLGDLIIYDLARKKETQLLKGWSLLQFVWSPDSKWIAFAREDNEYNSDIFIIPAEGGSEVNISRHPDEDEQPVWSDDGSRIAFRSRRRDNNWNIYLVQLKREDYEKSAADRAEEIRSKAKKENGKKSAKDKDDNKEKDNKDAVVTVTIDTTDIYKRIRAVTQFSGDEAQPLFSPDGEKVIFTANHEGDTDIYSIKWTGDGIKRLTNGSANPSSISFEAGGKRIRYLDASGHVKSIDADGGSAKDHPFDAQLEIDSRAEREQKFEEVWRGLNLRFYDDHFHGRNWVGLHDKYLPWAKLASCEEDFADVVRLMMGELNASHMGYYSPRDMSGKSTGRLGLDFDYTAGGEGLLVNHVVAYGPCDRVETKVKVGDRVLSIAGEKLTSDTSIEELLRNQIGQRTELILKRGKETKRLIVRPTNRGELGDLRYDEWVEGRRAMVDSLSGGRLGYLHIRGMGEGSLARFEAELYSVGNGREGLVVDVRYNGGGWTTDWLLAMLQVKRHAITFPRDGGPGYPQGRLPLYSWTKPIATLCNEYSFSNAEIFSHAVKTLGRGILVGVPTPGGVISTDGDGLLDGSYYRIPLRGWYLGSDTTRSPERNMEGNGAIPDHIVPLSPGEMAQGNDRQLARAVEELLNSISRGNN